MFPQIFSSKTFFALISLNHTFLFLIHSSLLDIFLIMLSGYYSSADVGLIHKRIQFFSLRVFSEHFSSYLRSKKKDLLCFIILNDFFG
jgi:hypothetical protein